MPINNTEFRYYDSNILRLPADKRKEYHEQVDRLINELSKRLQDQTDIKTTKVVKAGSFAKYTILRKTSEDPIEGEFKQTIELFHRNIYNTTAGAALNHFFISQKNTSFS